MGTSNPATLRALAASRDAQEITALLGDILTESRRAADNAQVLVDQLGGPVVPAAPDQEVSNAT